MKSLDQTALTALEKRSTAALAGVYGVRMLGLFLILPVFALYASGLPDVTPAMIGLAIGIYGLTQAALQIPLGMLSDRIGRKPVILGGLVIFALGSVVAALADSIQGIIIGRALQGSGAIAAASLALLADLTRDTVRARVMATVGMSIGLAFVVSMVAGPLLAGFMGVPGLFWLTAVLALLAIVITIYAVPTPSRVRQHRDAGVTSGYISTVLANSQLLRLDLGIFVLHAALMASWVVIPLLLEQQHGLPLAQHWQVYLPVLLFASIAMVPFIIVAEKYRHLKAVFTGAIATLVASLLLLSLLYQHYWGMMLAMWLYFTAFILLESLLPSLVAKIAPPDMKGTAMGVYTSSQFGGIFIGGVAGGWLFGQYGAAAVFMFCAALGVLWLVLAVTMVAPRFLSSYVLDIGHYDKDATDTLSSRLCAVTGVAEAVVIASEGMAYLKVDKRELDAAALQAVVGSRP